MFINKVCKKVEAQKKANKILGRSKKSSNKKNKTKQKPEKIKIQDYLN